MQIQQSRDSEAGPRVYRKSIHANLVKTSLVKTSDNLKGQSDLAALERSSAFFSAIVLHTCGTFSAKVSQFTPLFTPILALSA